MQITIHKTLVEFDVKRLSIYLQMIANSHEDFVMTPIKCPPPKIVAMKRSLRKASKKNIMDDEIYSDDVSLSSFDSKDLIEFEPDEPLIDLSDYSETESKDTVSSMNARNSTTLLSLLDLLEIGSVMRSSETAKLETSESCAKSEIPPKSPSPLRRSSSSSSLSFPAEYPCACATPSGKTNELSGVFPPLSKNSSIVKNYSSRSKTLQYVAGEAPEAPRSNRECAGDGIDARDVECSLQIASEKFEENLRENPNSTSIAFFCTQETPTQGDCKKDYSLGDLASEERQQNELIDTKTKEKLTNASELSDKNNNQNSVCNQNSLEPLTPERVNHRSCAKNKESDEALKFLSPHTSQRILPPDFLNSTTSLTQDCFEASSRLKRLEERFKGFSYTKKLLRNSKVFSKSEEILSSYGREKESKSCEPLNSSIHFPLSSSTSSENCLRQLTAEASRDDYPSKSLARKASSSDEISGELRGNRTLSFFRYMHFQNQQSSGVINLLTQSLTFSSHPRSQIT